MKKQFPDKRSASIDAAIIQDKRTLVLFLLGLALLTLELWPFKGCDVRCSYVVALDESRDQWRVISQPAGNTLDKIETLKAPASQVAATVLPLVPERETVGATPASLSLFINRPLPINRAGKDALEMLPGVGPHIADAILAELQHQGKFVTPDDLLKVSGIGPKSMQRLLPLISFE